MNITILEYLQDLTLPLWEFKQWLVQAAIAVPQTLWQLYCDFMTSLVNAHAQPEPCQEPIRKGRTVSPYIPPSGYWTIHRLEF